ncbi:hypothetical protein [Arthrobacter roseus]|uniref:hypothetical protein n=1 Tax=Arthrobacter roseus TaxID=136274 RepID=UPI00196452ED|nr:hypothetical protein [Arthrobacter roseus]MBM7847018.1 hypothetical protein [Arthrobacter roseus]
MADADGEAEPDGERGAADDADGIAAPDDDAPPSAEADDAIVGGCVSGLEGGPVV